MADQSIQFEHKGGFGFIEADGKGMIRLRIEGVPTSDIFFPAGETSTIQSIVLVDFSIEQGRALAEAILRDRSTGQA